MLPQVYLGIDVHKRTYAFAFVKDGVVVKKGSCKADPAEFSTKIKDWFPDHNIKSVYEAGFCGYTLHRQLKSQGVDNIIIDPASVVRAPNDRVKTDALDARKLANYLEKGLLNGIAIPEVEEVNLRTVTRIREQLVDHRKSVSNQR